MAAFSDLGSGEKLISKTPGLGERVALSTGETPGLELLKEEEWDEEITTPFSFFFCFDLLLVPTVFQLGFNCCEETPLKGNESEGGKCE